MFRETAPDGTSRLTGAGLPTRLGWTENWTGIPGSAINASFGDGYPARVGDLLVSKNGFSVGDIVAVTKVYPDDTVNFVRTLQNMGSHDDTYWLNVGDAGQPAFQNGWGNYGSPFARVRFRRMNRVVYVQGLAALGTVNTAVFTLPIGFRPTSQLIFTAITNSVVTSSSTAGGTAHTHTLTQHAGRVDVRIDGSILQTGASTNNWFSLDAISFPAEA